MWPPTFPLDDLLSKAQSAIHDSPGVVVVMLDSGGFVHSTLETPSYTAQTAVADCHRLLTAVPLPDVAQAVVVAMYPPFDGTAAAEQWPKLRLLFHDFGHRLLAWLLVTTDEVGVLLAKIA